MACIVFAACAATSPALADDKAACLSAIDKAQDLRTQSKLTEARAQLLVCARQTCPPVIVQDCLQWLRDVERALPSVSISARDEAGRDLSAVRVSVDGAQWLASLDTKAHAIDPGRHTFRFERIDGKSPPMEQEVLVREGEQDRVVSVTLGALGGPQQEHTVAAETHAPKGSALKPVGLAIMIAGAGSLVAAGVLGGVSASSWGSVSSACRGGTTPCSPAERNDAALAGTTADWSTALFVAGGAAAAAGLAMFLFAPKHTSTTASIAPTAGGFTLSLTGRF